jgi:hypothetical protein
MRASDTTIGLRRRLPAGGVLVAALALCACLAAGCGGGSPDAQVASVATTTPAATQPATTNGVAKSTASTQTYSACMRANGVPKFPDANSDGGIAIDSSSGINPDSPQFKAAEKACAKLAPQGGKAPSAAEQAKQREQQLKLSACMRTHGVPKYPDPVFSDGGRRTSLRIDSKSGIDPHSPIFQAAQKTCQKLVPDLDGKGGSLHTQGTGPPTGGSSSGTSSR